MNRGHKRTSPRLLMCAPAYYGIEYEINPWMNRSQAAVASLATEQWERLVDLFHTLGAGIEFIDPVPGLPDMVFTANAGVIHRGMFVTSHFRHPERQGESAYFEQWFAKRGFRVASLPILADFEGAGDALYCGDTLFAGYLHRSELKAHHKLSRLLCCQVLGLELVDPRFYHLDTCFCPLAPGRALYYPGAFDEYGRRVLAENIEHLIPVDEADALRFGCNAVVLGDHVVVNEGADKLTRELSKLGYLVHATPLGEFVKSGGSAKCLTLRLDGEDAAGW